MVVFEFVKLWWYHDNSLIVSRVLVFKLISSSRGRVPSSDGVLMASSRRPSMASLVHRVGRRWALHLVGRHVIWSSSGSSVRHRGSSGRHGFSLAFRAIWCLHPVLLVRPVHLVRRVRLVRLVHRFV